MNMLSTLQIGRMSRFFSTQTRRLIKKGVVSPILKVPSSVQRPSIQASGDNMDEGDSVPILDAEGIECMRKANRVAREASIYAGTLVQPGVSLDSIDRQVHEFIVSKGCYPGCLGYSGYPKSTAISVNEVVCHGIPDSTVLLDGDVVSVDLTVFCNNYFGDTCRTFCCGNVDESGQKLVQATYDAMMAGIRVCKDGVKYSEIGKAISQFLKPFHYGIVRDYSGHGIGRFMHQSPYILHFENTYGGIMKKNQAFTIEPMITEFSPATITWNDHWTVATRDNGRCAQFEHTILITDNGCEILT